MDVAQSGCLRVGVAKRTLTSLGLVLTVVGILLVSGCR